MLENDTDDLLDEPQIEPIRKKTFSILSFAASLATILLIVGFFYQIQLPPWPASSLVSLVLLILAGLSWLSGFVFTFFSFIRNEPDHAFKWIGAVLNTFIFVLIVFPIFISLI